MIEYTTEKSVVDYSIQVDSKKIYEGKAYKLPGDTVVRVIPNRIVENYLYAEADFNKIKAGTINQVESTQLRDIRVKSILMTISIRPSIIGRIIRRTI